MRQSFSLHQHPKQFMLSPLQQLHSSAPQEASSSTRLWTYKTTYLYSGSLFALTLLFIQRSGSGFDEMKPRIPCKFKARKSLIYLLLDCKLYKALPMIALLPLYSGPNWLSNFVQNFSLFGAELRTLSSLILSLRSARLFGVKDHRVLLTIGLANSDSRNAASPPPKSSAGQASKRVSVHCHHQDMRWYRASNRVPVHTQIIR